MSDIERLLAQASDEAERSADNEPLTGSYAVIKPNRAKSIVVSVRLNAAEAAQVQHLADDEGIPFSTAARALILRALKSGSPRNQRNLSLSPMTIDSFKSLLDESLEEHGLVRNEMTSAPR